MNSESMKSFVRLLLVVGAVLLLSVIGQFLGHKRENADGGRAAEATAARADEKAMIDKQGVTKSPIPMSSGEVSTAADTGTSSGDARDSGRGPRPEVVGSLNAAETGEFAQSVVGAETELERQNRLWREGVAAGAGERGSRAHAEARAKELFPDDPVAEILWAAGFEWGSH